MPTGSLSYLVYASALKKQKEELEISPASVSKPSPGNNSSSGCIGNKIKNNNETASNVTKQQQQRQRQRQQRKHHHPSYSQSERSIGKFQHDSWNSPASSKCMSQPTKPVRRISSSFHNINNNNNYNKKKKNMEEIDENPPPPPPPPLVLKRNESMLSLTSSSVYTSATTSPQEKEAVLYSSFRKRASVWSQKNTTTTATATSGATAVATNPNNTESCCGNTPSPPERRQSSVIIMMTPPPPSPSTEEENNLSSLPHDDDLQTQPPTTTKVLLRDLIHNAGILSEISSEKIQQQHQQPTSLTQKSSILSYSSSSGGGAGGAAVAATSTSLESKPIPSYSDIQFKPVSSSSSSSSSLTSTLTSAKEIIWNHNNDTVILEPKLDNILQVGMQQVLDEVLTMDSDSPLPCTCSNNSSTNGTTSDDQCIYHDGFFDTENSDDNNNNNNNSDHDEEDGLSNLHDSISNNDNDSNVEFHNAVTPAVKNRKSTDDKDRKLSSLSSSSRDDYTSIRSNNFNSYDYNDSLSSKNVSVTPTPQRRTIPDRHKQTMVRFSKFTPPPPPQADDAVPSRSNPSSTTTSSTSMAATNSTTFHEQNDTSLKWKSHPTEAGSKSTMQAYGYPLPHGSIQKEVQQVPRKSSSSSSSGKNMLSYLKSNKTTGRPPSPRITPLLPPSYPAGLRDHPSQQYHHPYISSIRRLSHRSNSLLSFSTMVSEITTSTDINKTGTTATKQFLTIDILPPLKINPKAPQYQMALEQQEQFEQHSNTTATSATKNDTCTKEDDTMRTHNRTSNDDDDDDDQQHEDGNDMAGNNNKMQLAAKSTINGSSVMMKRRPERRQSPATRNKPSVEMNSTTQLQPPPMAKPPARTTTPQVLAVDPASSLLPMPIRSTCPIIEQEALSTAASMVDLDPKDSILKTTSPELGSFIIDEDDKSPGIVSTVEFANPENGQEYADDDDEMGATFVHRPTRVSTLTYPSFDPSSPQKDVKPKVELNKEIHLTRYSSRANSTQSLYQDEEEKTLAGSDDNDEEEDIGNRPRQLEYIPSIDGSDMISSYATSSSSSNLTPASLRDGSRKPRRSNSDDESTPPLPPKRIDEHSPQQKLSEMEESMTGPFISPRDDKRRANIIPKTPQHDSNPLLFPLNLTPPVETNLDALASNLTGTRSPRSPTTTGHTTLASAELSVLARTPQQDSNPLMFPQGLSFYPKTPFGDEENETDEDITVKAASSNREIECTFTPSPITRSKSLADINLSNHDSELYASKDLSLLSPEAILERPVKAEVQVDMATMTSPREYKPPYNPKFTNKTAKKGCHPSKGQSPNSLTQPITPRRSLSCPQSTVQTIHRMERKSSEISSTANEHDEDESTTTGGMPSVTSSPYSRQSHSSRFTVTGTDPKNHFELVLHRDSLMEASVFTEEDDESDDDRSDVDVNADEIIVEEIVEFPAEEEEEDDESAFTNASNHMSVVKEEASECDSDYDDSSTDDVTALDDQSEQYEPLNDESQCSGEESRDGSERNRYKDVSGLARRPSSLSNSLEPLPSLVSNTSSSNSNASSAFPRDSPSVVSSVTETSSVALLRVRMCPMKIVYVLDGEENEYTGFYSGPINGRGEMHGNGVFWFNTGDLYLGEFCCNSLHGCGMLSIMVEDEVEQEMDEVLTWNKQILKGYFHWNEYVGKVPLAR